ncbi:helix-turn-helix transcriptional regulator [Blastococcus saxobsidens]|uniref:Putative ATPase n=1 Tax=Blastococcus saxobsidens TaxID=138336 RepID=A0A4Q7Y726_9ACTN|nr:LuxR C-terminal-related transcriptional regulator [Blastococcus saxobsidens]RZU31755.1 putative ATPase [Blastococcus saxobsidens]
MAELAPLVGRDDERRLLVDALTRCRAGQGGVVLVSGEAGVGKTRLVSEVLGRWDGDVLAATATPGGAPYDVLDSALACAVGARRQDRDTDAARVVTEALRATTRIRPTVVVLEDLHLADAASMEVLVALAQAPPSELLVLGIYRSDGLPRSSPIRVLRTELRRARRLVDVALRTLTEAQTGELLADLLGTSPSARLVEVVHGRTEGLPFFVEELVWALRDAGCLTERAGAVELDEGAGLPLPESVTDAVLSRTAQLRADHGAAVQCAVALGVRVDLPALAELAGPAEADRLIDEGLLVELDGGLAVFRHALVREALYRSIPWSRRRALHHDVAELLTDHGAPPAVVAEHWLDAHEPAKARPLLVAAAEALCATHAYRDAADLAHRALALWPDGDDPAGRLTVLEGLGECAERSADPRTAAEVWAEVAEGCRGTDVGRAALAHRRAANAAELAGDLSRTAAERASAAEAFEQAARPAEAAEQRLALCAQLRSAGRLSEALHESVAATGAARRAARRDLEAHALVLEGAVRAALGGGQRAVQFARAGLELAVSEQVTGLAAEAQYGLAEALEYAADYAGAVHAYESAYELCRADGLEEFAAICFVCMSPAARLMGEWDRTLTVCADVLADDGVTTMARRVAEEESGLIAVLRGERRGMRGPLRRAADFGRAQGIFGLEVGATWGLAMAADLDGDADTAVTTARRLMERCRDTEECHYALPALRWAATFLAAQGDAAGVAACHRMTADKATRNGSSKVLSALAHVGGELAAVDGDAAAARASFGRSVELLADITAPYEEAHARLRVGQLCAVLGDRAAAVPAISSAYRTARRLLARPLARRCATALAELGEPVEQRLGRLAARGMEPNGLTRREAEVLQRLAHGRTNREIAGELFLSTRTVDMHVRNVFSKLDCSSRAAAVRRAVQRGLIAVR